MTQTFIEYARCVGPMGMLQAAMNPLADFRIDVITSILKITCVSLARGHTRTRTRCSVIAADMCA